MMSATYSLRRPLGHANCETDRRRMRPSSAANGTVLTRPRRVDVQIERDFASLVSTAVRQCHVDGELLVEPDALQQFLH